MMGGKQETDRAGPRTKRSYLGGGYDRLRAGGKRVWIAQYRMGQKQRRVTIGSVETLDPDQARRAAKAILAKAHLGNNPQAAKVEAKARAHYTVGAMVVRGSVA
jgi:Arm DNA-binding domain